MQDTETLPSFTSLSQADLNKLSTYTSKHEFAGASPIFQYLKYKNLHRIVNQALWHGDEFLMVRDGESSSQTYELEHVSLKRPHKPDDYEPLVPEVDYWPNQIKGFCAKVNALKSLMGNSKKTKQLRMAVICAKGNEEEAINFLLMDQNLKMPPVPDDVQRRHRADYDLKMDIYNKEMRDYRDLKTITQQEMNQIRTLSLAELAQDPLLVRKRTLLLKNQVKRMKETMQEQETRVLRHKNSLAKKDSRNHSLSNGEVSVPGKLSMADRNRLYLPGEFECMQTRTFRKFLFFPERTFANETSHIHFRVAEATFHRFVSSGSKLRVTKVEYIVNPPLREAFDERRRKIAQKRSVSFENVTPYLLHAPHRSGEDVINGLVENGFRKCTCVSTIEISARKYGVQKSDISGQIILSLVLPNSNCRLGDKKIHRISADHANDILPYYLVTFSSPTQIMGSGTSDCLRPLDEEWTHIAEDAKTDKFQNEMKEYYKEALVKKSKERQMGELCNLSDLWFNQFYAKRYEQENEFRMDDSPGEGSAEYEIEFPSDDDDLAYDTDTPSATPLTGISTASSDIFVVEDETDEEDQDGDNRRMSQQ
eukprot:CAMPEP_0117445210 /NCGR_PEP_ID=MMETSP0759-20121206/5671_1 /TAXON_ID=63605 /ORGANISM="Percolomonas cosmopolitus, Strain WS" /LENGTH=592 /DNA_ID=CAMNT_0005237365 /DNA_START=128 /DNA_END=1906 /DNA_ORIENTATION=-